QGAVAVDVFVDGSHVRMPVAALPGPEGPVRRKPGPPDHSREALENLRESGTVEHQDAKPGVPKPNDELSWRCPSQIKGRLGVRVEPETIPGERQEERNRDVRCRALRARRVTRPVDDHLPRLVERVVALAESEDRGMLLESNFPVGGLRLGRRVLGNSWCQAAHVNRSLGDGHAVSGERLEGWTLGQNTQNQEHGRHGSVSTRMRYAPRYGSLAPKPSRHPLRELVTSIR